MLLKNNKTKEAYLIVKLLQDENSVVREISVENEEDFDFYGAQKIDFKTLNIERRIKYLQGHHFTFSTDKIHELMQIKSEKQFADKYYPAFELYDDAGAYYSLVN